MRPIIQATFELKATNEAAWGLEARRLKRAADVLFAKFREDAGRLDREEVIATELENLDLLMPASLLYGLALENVFKGIIIQQRKPTVNDLPGLFGGGSGHNLADLAQRASFTLSPDERDLVNRLSAFVEWAGRYPVAKKVEKMAIGQKAVTGEWPPLPLQQHEAGLYEALFTRAEAVIFRLCVGLTAGGPVGGRQRTS